MDPQVGGTEPRMAVSQRRRFGATRTRQDGWKACSMGQRTGELHVASTGVSD